MAIALDINLLCNKMLNSDIVSKLLNQYSVSIESMSSIDNWMWENEKKIDSFETILDARHIVVIKLKRPLVKDMGIFIEKMENHYLYEVWVNTEGYPMLDCDKITLDNHEFYKDLLQAILEADKAIDIPFEMIGIFIIMEI